MKERKAQKIVIMAELEDNCGAVVAKGKIEIPIEGNALLDGHEHKIVDEFREFLRSKFPVGLKL
jgi:hypothetical protein